MVVRAAAYDGRAPLLERLDHSLCIGADLLCIDLEFGLGSFLQADGLACDDVHQRSALDTREDGAVDRLTIGFLTEDHTAARPAQGLVRGGGHNIRVGDGGGMLTCSDQACDVRHVYDQICAHFVCDAAEGGEVDDARVGGSACHDGLWMKLFGLLFHVIVIDIAVLVHAVVNKVVHPSGEADRCAVRQMSAVVQIHGQHRVAGLKQGKVGRHVCAGTAVGLYVGVFCAEQLLGKTDCFTFHLIDDLAAAIVPRTGVALGILVGQYAAHCRKHGGGNEVLGCDQFQTVVLSVLFQLDQFRNRCHDDYLPISV